MFVNTNALEKQRSFLVSNGVFPTISVNKSVTAFSNSSPPSVNFWVQRAPKKNNTCYPAAIIHSPQWVSRGMGDVKNTGYWPQIAEMHIKSIILVNPDSCIFLYIKKCQIPWDIWFSLINNNLLMFRLSAFCCKLLCNLIPSDPTSSKQFSQVAWDVSPAWSPKNSHQKT